MITIFDYQKKYPTIPFVDVMLLIAHALKKTKEYILAHGDHPLTFVQQLRLTYALQRYKKGTPLAYITHHKEFYGLDFYVNKHTLIPRPETELLVEEALQKINALTSPAAQQKILVVDVGTGSGCIPVAITKKIAPKQLPILAIDTAHAALKIAQKNAGQYHLHNIKFLKGSLIEPLTINQLNNYSTLLITANLPYLTEEQFIDEPSIQKEPYTALVAQENGLQLYRELLEQLSSLPSSIQTVYAFFEIDPSQTRSITSLIKKSLPGSTTTFKKDLAGRDRVVSISLTRNI